MTISGVCYSDIHYGGVRLYQWGSPPVVSIFLMSIVFSGPIRKYLLQKLSFPGVYKNLCLPFDATLLMIPSLHPVFKTLDFPSSEGVLNTLVSSVPGLP